MYTISDMPHFEWDDRKNKENQAKHNVSFGLAQYAFSDPERIITKDMEHGSEETRFFCFGKAGGGILTVRFTFRNGRIRIIGAGYWRKGRAIYEKENKIHG